MKTGLNFEANTLYCYINPLKVRDELVRQNKIAQKWVTISSGVTIFSKHVILVCIVLVLKHLLAFLSIYFVAALAIYNQRLS